MNDLSLMSILPRLFISMAAVIVVMWIAARVLKNREGRGGVTRHRSSGGGAFKKAPVVQVLGRSGVGRHASIAVVRAGEKALIVGVTDTNVSLLGELEPADLGTSTEAQGTGSSDVMSIDVTSQAWSGLLTQVRERTVRRS